MGKPKAPLDCIKGSWRAAPEGIKATVFPLYFVRVCRGRCPHRPVPAAAESPPLLRGGKIAKGNQGGEYLSSSPSQPLTDSPLFVEGAFGRSSAPPLQALRDTLIKSTGLPHQCAHWFAMTRLLGTSGRPMVAPTKHIGIGIERRKTPPSRAVFVDFIPDRWLRRCAYAPSACGTGR